jgi:heterodisulfide reductase subunit A-like polyferredoxin
MKIMHSKQTETISCDVLVIGRDVAGLRAAMVASGLVNITDQTDESQ